MESGRDIQDEESEKDNLRKGIRKREALNRKSRREYRGKPRNRQFRERELREKRISREVVTIKWIPKEEIPRKRIPRERVSREKQFR